MTISPTTTRLAPSPTGALHLGNARTFLLNWLFAKQCDWRVRFRVEDLDGPRVKPGGAKAAMEDLRWLGLTWDEPVVYQSQHAAAYQAALAKLIEAGWAYPCVCSRKDAERAASAPTAEDGAAAYPGTCRGRFATAQQARAETGRAPAWRLRVHDRPIRFADRFAGTQEFNLSETCGDFVVFRREALAAYQLAVVVDDAEAGVDAVFRGDDLLASAAMQIHLRQRLGLSNDVAYWHVPLVLGSDGRKLAKRHGDTRLRRYIDLGVSRPRVLGLLGYFSGLLPRREETDLDALLRRFDPHFVPHNPVIFTREDEAFLTGSAFEA